MNTMNYTCPSCGESFEPPAGKTKFFCPYCGTAITPEPVRQNAAAAQNVPRTAVTFQDSGIALGSAVIPAGWKGSASYKNQGVDELTPFATSASAISPDGMQSVGCRYGEHWYHFLYNGLLQTAYPKNMWRKFIEPNAYLQEIAERMAGVRVEPVSVGPIPTLFHKNRNQEAGKLVSRFEENAHIELPSVQCDLRLQNLMCEGRGLISHYEKDGRQWTIFTGADLFGLEYYDNSAMGKLNRGMTDVLRLKGFNKKKAETNELPAFGHAKDAGKDVDVIEWGAKRFYFAAGPREQEAEVIQNFMVFAESWKQDAALDQRLVQHHAQLRQQEIANLQNAMNYALQSQQINMQRQAQISQTLSETSDIIMQGYANRSASMDRISDKWSEAIRGVNSYQTTDGRTVEHSVVSDHVYQNSYGDTIGVSGSLDEVPHDWTELQKKD